MVKIYGIKNCDSVKKAVNFFKKHAIAYELFDFKTQKLPCEKISYWLTRVEIKTLFNSRSTTYRTLKLKELNLSQFQQEEWLCKENLLIKRPIVEFEEKVFVAYNEEIYQRNFL